MILFKKLWRTILKYKAQFFSMIIMLAIGVGIFFGFNIEWYSIEKNANKFFNDTNFANYRVYTNTGFSAEDVLKIKNISGVQDASRWLSVNVGISGSKAKLNLNVVENYGISSLVIVSGKDYDEDNNGIWLSQKFAEANNLGLNDTITLNCFNENKTFNIVGLVRNAEFLVCTEDENEIMPKFDEYGFCFISPKTIKNEFNTEYYNQISIKSDLSKKEIEPQIEKTLNKTLLILSLDENKSYLSAQSEIEEGKTMGSILPVLFILIAVLSMITTMHRITKNEKTQIGTLKALGFKDKKILWHYTSFGFAIGTIGSVLGVILGFLIASIVVSPSGMISTYFDFISWGLYVPWFCYAGLALMILFMTGISLLTVKNILKGQPAETLRPYTPKKLKQTKIEKTKLWNKFSFGTKWNLRDIFRNKARSLMSLFGVVGCVILIVGSLGMKDSMDGFLNILDKSMNYQTKINISETASLDKINELENTYNTDSIEQVSIKFNEKTISLDIYDIKNGLYKFYNEKNNEVTLSDDGVYICIRLANQGVKIGDTITISPYGTNEHYKIKVAGIIRSLLSENITMTRKCAESFGITYKPTALFTSQENINISDTSTAPSTQEKTKILGTYDEFLKIMNVMIFILIVAALGLGIIVLYNLGVMSYIERYREFATLKVVGFKDKNISHLLISQNVWITIFGIILGLPLGYGVLYWLVTALASEYEMKITISVLSFIIGIVLTFGVSLLVSLLISKKNKHIDMVEALKDKE